jgi:5-deoxy-glucuronate isomerase
MIVKKPSPFDWGYTAITELDGRHREMLLDFEILKVKAGEEYHCSLLLERV